MEQSGITTQGNPVMKGVFFLVGTHGVPLEIILEKFKTNNWVVDWLDYISGALKDGHNGKTIYSRVTAAVGDVYGRKYKQEIEKRLIILSLHKD